MTYVCVLQALAEVDAAKKQLLLLDAEAQGSRIKKAAVDEAAEGLAASSSRQAAALEEQRAALGELLRQLEAREDAVSQVRRGQRGDQDSTLRPTLPSI